jgi:hypothetical protein
VEEPEQAESQPDRAPAVLVLDLGDRFLDDRRRFLYRGLYVIGLVPQRRSGRAGCEEAGVRLMVDRWEAPGTPNDPP